MAKATVVRMLGVFPQNATGLAEKRLAFRIQPEFFVRVLSLISVTLKRFSLGPTF